VEKYPRRKKMTRREALGVIAGGAAAAAGGIYLFEKESGREQMEKPGGWLDEVGKFKKLYSSVKPNYDPERWGDGPKDPESYLDIVLHYGKRETINGGGLSRTQFVRENIVEGSRLPAFIKKELRDLSVGLAAQESAFHNGLVSRSGAKGIFQFMPATWKGLGYKTNDIKFLTNQVEATSKLFVQSHAVLFGRSGKTLEEVKKIYFNGDDEMFEKYFITPVLVNAHNAGAGRMARVVGWFGEDMLARGGSAISEKQYSSGVGYDLFYAMSKAARKESDIPLLKGYGADAAGYVPRVYALAELIREKEGY